MTDPRFTPSLVAMAQASHKKFWPRGPFVSISLAQWAVESDFGAHMSGVNNPFGIQATESQRVAGQARLVRSFEWTGTEYAPKEEWFANYPSLEAAFDAHASLLTTPRYQRCILAKTPAMYAQALHLCGYATAPDYARELTSVIADNDLTQFDVVPPTQTKDPPA